MILRCRIELRYNIRKRTFAMQAVRAVHISTKLANCRCDVNLYLQGDQVSYVIGTQQYSKAVKLNMVIFRMVKSRNFNELRNSKLAWSSSILQKRDNNLLFYICFRHHYQILLLLPCKDVGQWEICLYGLYFGKRNVRNSRLCMGDRNSERAQRLELRVCTIRRP